MSDWQLEKEAVNAMFPEKESRKNVERYFQSVAKALDESGLHDPIARLAAYATIRAESASFRPITEGKSKYNTLTIPPEYGIFDTDGTSDWSKYQGKKGLDNSNHGDGKKFVGRGFVQLTGRHNYEKYGEKLSVDLINNPEKANEADVAAALLANFVADKQEIIRTSLLKGDYKAARAAVNGGSNGLNEFKVAYKKGLSIYSLGMGKIYEASKKLDGLA